MVVGNPETDTDNDFEDPSGSSFHPVEDISDHMNLAQALSAMEEEEQLFQSQSKSQSSQQQPRDDSDINWDEYMNVPETDHLEDFEFPLDRQLRLLQEAEEEEQRGGLTGRLTAPLNEKRSRPTTQSSNRIIDQLRAKQLELVDVQLKVQQKLLENAEIANEEAQERLKMTTAQRKQAEIELQIKEREINSLDK